MTATALANDPILDLELPADGPFGQHAMDQWFEAVQPRGARRPQAPALQVIQGDGIGSVDPMVEVYRRRRFALALALTAVIVLVSQLAGLSLTSFGPTVATTDESMPHVHIVRPGDSYAGIASELGAEQPNEVADELRIANGGGELQVGQRLVIDLDGVLGLG